MKPNPLLAICVGLAFAFVFWAVMFVAGGVESHGLETGCRTLQPGDDIETVMATLGLPGYRPGCDATGAGTAAGLPCARADQGALKDFPYLCEGDDCSLYWRLLDVACLVEIDPATMRVTGTSFMTLGAGSEGGAPQ